ncbi:MAG: hypothetical protein ACLQF4_12285 [Xanthobacteraceae bacterium]
MREYDDYDDENIRLYTPVLQRVIILAAVIIAVPVMMWTITTFVRSYVARPQAPALEHVASANMPAGLSAISPAPPSPAPSPADQSASQRVEGASASDAPSRAAETRNGVPNLASLPDASAPPAAVSSPFGASLQAIQAPSPALTATATTTGDISTGSSTAAPASPAPKLPLAPRSNDNAASTGAPNSSDRGLAWPNPNATSPPDFAAPRLQPLPAPARTAAAEVLPADEPIRGPVPLPRQRPGIAMAAAATGPVALPRARPDDAPAAAGALFEMPAGARPDLESPR